MNLQHKIYSLAYRNYQSIHVKHKVALTKNKVVRSVEIVSLGKNALPRPTEAELLLAQMYQTAAISNIQCRFRWEPDSFAFWDNRGAQHYAAADYWPAVRSMERVTIKGDRPV